MPGVRRYFRKVQTNFRTQRCSVTRPLLFNASKIYHVIDRCPELPRGCTLNFGVLGTRQERRRATGNAKYHCLFLRPGRFRLPRKSLASCAGHGGDDAKDADAPLFTEEASASFGRDSSTPRTSLGKGALADFCRLPSRPAEVDAEVARCWHGKMEEPETARLRLSTRVSRRPPFVSDF